MTHRLALVVEDNEVSAFLATELLTEAGYEVEVVTDGERAVDALATRAYDVVLMDTQLPGIDGLAATRRIRQMGGLCAIVVIIGATASDSPRTRADCLLAGMDDHLAKPIRPDALREALSRLVGGEHPSSDSAIEHEMRTLDELERHLGPSAHEALALFLQRSRERTAEVLTALADGDLALVGRVAHSIRGSIGAIGATTLAAIAGRLEAAALEGDLAHCRRLGDDLVREARRFQQDLARRLGVDQ